LLTLIYVRPGRGRDADYVLPIISPVGRLIRDHVG
jgi:hypothetical protein